MASAVNLKEKGWLFLKGLNQTESGPISNTNIILQQQQIRITHNLEINIRKSVSINNPTIKA